MAEEVVTHPEPFSSYDVDLWEALLKTGNEFPSQIMTPNSPENFSLRFFFAEDLDELAVIRDILDNFFDMIGEGDGDVLPPKHKPVRAEHFQIGLPVAVFLDQENAFFRAILLKDEGSSCLCYLIDLGCEESVNVSNISYLPRSLLEVECQTIHCKLGDVTTPVETAPKYPWECSQRMMELSGSVNPEELNRSPLMCKIIEVIKPKPVEFDSAWRFHRNLLTNLVVELTKPESEHEMARQPHGFAHLLASLGLCRIVPSMNPQAIASELTANVGSTKSPRKIKKKQSRAHLPPPPGLSPKGRGRGNQPHLPLKDCPPLLFDSD